VSVEQRRQILLNTCARASTAAESRFRIDHGVDRPRASRIIALDAPAADLVQRLNERSWQGGHFLVFDRVASASDGSDPDAVLRTADGTTTSLVAELEDADVVVMIATGAASHEAAAVLGDACAGRPVMSAALVVAPEGDESVDGAVAALRPNAMVMVRLHDENDVPDVLTALRA
jgi:hypothetical protein